MIDQNQRRDRITHRNRELERLVHDRTARRFLVPPGEPRARLGRVVRLAGQHVREAGLVDPGALADARWANQVGERGFEEVTQFGPQLRPERGPLGAELHEVVDDLGLRWVELLAVHHG